MSAAPPQPACPVLEVVDNTGIKVSWEPVNCKPAATNYAVALMRGDENSECGPTTWYVDRQGKSHADKKNANVFAASTKHVTCVELAEGTPYRAQISVKNGEKWSPYSELSAPVKIEKPQPPTPPMIQVLDLETIKVSWTLGELNCSPPATNVAIAWKDDGPGIRYVDRKGGLNTDRVPVVDPGVKEVIVSGLKEGVAYKAQMAVQNAVGWSKYSAFCPVDKIAKPIQLDPPILKVIHGDRIQVHWDPPKSGLPCTAYAVAMNDGKVTLYLDSKGAPHDNKDHASTIPHTQTSIMVPLLLENVPYKAQVASRNALGWGPYSDFSKVETVVRVKKKESLVVEEDDFDVTM